MNLVASPSSPAQTGPELGGPAALACGEQVDAGKFARLRRQLVLECCKWDPQVGDVSTLAPFPLLLPRREWEHLRQLAEALSRELAAAELELLERPELIGQLGLPRRIRLLFERAAFSPPTVSAARVLRYDFHPTAAGWQLSEVNSDVPGGFTEASSFTAMMAEASGLGEPAGSPIDAWADALAAIAGEAGSVALLSAPGYMEDHQVVAYLGGHLRARGCRTQLAKPEQIRWHDGHAELATRWHTGPVAAIARFYQGEWLAALPAHCGWEHFFLNGRTPVCNPGTALLAESKRFPLTWPALQTAMPTWRTVLPETRGVAEAPWESDEGWLVKPAFCNTGDAVHARPWLSEQQWRSATKDVRRHPERWIAQRRFVIQPLATPIGLLNPCLGVYVIAGAVAGIYARLAPGPVVDFSALDAAVLISDRA